ncbi:MULTISPECIES: histidine phosphatase family protein [Myxococcus]|uniref:histidine phosphatase family protein n=1 Tax=Myxococcus TaxID=32 RepID=UPI0011449DF3|nr:MULTISPECIES: histidine phosphatase family protein [Myxococcus]NOK00670.1 histidine phosphatase family protein [Myxococcus xanthus]
MSRGELILVRHGQSSSNAMNRATGEADAALTPLGQRQAEAAAQAIAVRPVAALYTSDLRRAVESACALEQRTGLTAVRTDALRERSLGQLSELPFPELAARHPEDWAAIESANLEARPPGGESLRDCSRRLLPFLTQLLTRHEGERVVLVSHRMLLDHVLRLVLGVEETQPRCTFDTDNGGIHRLQHWDGCVRLLELNGTSHLR